MTKYTMLVSIVLTPISFSTMAMSDANKVGANAGAMIYCADNHASGGDKIRYRSLKKKTKQDYSALDS